MEIIFTTAFKDIHRSKWNHYQRTNADYYNDFYKLAENIHYKLIVYLEKGVKETMKQFDNILFVEINEVDTFYDKYLERDKEIIESESYKDKIPMHRKFNPEHVYAEYNLINNSKINFVKHTKMLFPNYEYYAWIDFGTFNRNIENIPKNINIKLLPSKITYNCFTWLDNATRPDPIDMLASDVIYFQGSTFIVHNEYVNLFHDLWEKKLVEFQEKNITDDDQNVVLQIYFDNPMLFNKVYTNNWYSLYKDTLNQKI
jgi:hypothetical protein